MDDVERNIDRGIGADFSIRSATLLDAEAIRQIYNEEVENSTATMDLVPRTLDEQRQWQIERSGAFTTLVAVDRSGSILGFAALSPYKERAAYRPTVEDSVYVHDSYVGRGIGKALLTAVVEAAAESGFHSVIARISSSGEASQALHRACGFREIGREIEVARKFNRWIDVVVMQRMLQ
ncbi:MAG: N-acetyltransferase family protein [Actinomycetota bacterium]